MAGREIDLSAPRAHCLLPRETEDFCLLLDEVVRALKRVPDRKRVLLAQMRASHRRMSAISVFLHL